ncbi:DUF1493 family protein [Burkholderia metallica]
MDARLIEMIKDEADSPLWGELDLTSDTDLCVDLEFTHRAMLRFMQKFSETFDVDIGNFDIDYYYPSRKMKLGKFLVELAKSPFSESARDKIMDRPLTIGMLEVAIKDGKWRM